MISDDVGRPRIVADVRWADKDMWFSLQKFGEDWKIAGVD